MAALLRITISRCIRYFLNFSKKFNRKTNRNFLRNPSFSKIYQRIKYKKIPSSPKLNLLERVFETGRGRLIPRKNLAKIPRSPKHQNIRSTFSPRAKKISLSLSSPLGEGTSLDSFLRYRLRTVHGSIYRRAKG